MTGNYMYHKCLWKMKKLWRPCNFTPTHSLTGPVGQPFASRLAEVGKVTLKSNGDEALKNEFILKSKGDEALNDGFP